MSFTPMIPMGGLAGWRFLERTGEMQRAAFDRGAALARETAYFTENIGKITSAEELVRDRRLLKVALGAFGLEGEIDKKFFIRKVLESDPLDPKSMANRLSDPAFGRLAKAFGFGDLTGPNIARAEFAGTIVAQYRARQFESAVGEVDNSMRLAMNFRREIGAVAAGSEGAAWFTLLGSKPLREVVQTALGLPQEFARIDIDRQRDMIRDRMAAAFGDSSIAFFREPANVERVIERFLARAQITGMAAGNVATSPALQLLQNANGGAAGIFNLLLSRI